MMNWVRESPLGDSKGRGGVHPGAACARPSRDAVLVTDWYEPWLDTVASRSRRKASRSGTMRPKATRLVELALEVALDAFASSREDPGIRLASGLRADNRAQRPACWLLRGKRGTKGIQESTKTGSRRGKRLQRPQK